MSLIRRCDICKRDIENGSEFKHILTHVVDEELTAGVDLGSIDVCPSCWTLLIHDIKAKIQICEAAKEADKMLSDP